MNEVLNGFLTFIEYNNLTLSEKLLVNKFSLWVEKIDKIESIPSTEKKQ